MSPETEELYAKYAQYIKDYLFLLPFGGHGIGHTKRVLQLALMIASSYTLTTSEIKTLAVSCCYHDIGRDRECVDDEHGAKSAKKFLKLKLNELHNLTQEELEIVLNLITMHSLDDALFVGGKRETFLFKILKDADALDRIRFSDLDPKFLRLAASLNLIETAAGLCTQQKN